MGCVTSKSVDESSIVQPYRPAPASATTFNIDAIGEPWLITAAAAGKDQQRRNRPGGLAVSILDNFEAYDAAPQSWSEVSRALEELKPAILRSPASEKYATVLRSPVWEKNRSTSLPTSEERETTHVVVGLPERKPLPVTSPSPARNSTVLGLPEGLRPVSRNSFVLRDKLEREKSRVNEAEQFGRNLRKDPLLGLQELCPPDGEESVVLYTTTLRGIRRTFEDCETCRQILESHSSHLGFDVDERDVSLHGEFLKELCTLLEDTLTVDVVSVPRLFVRGKYVGGVVEIVQFNETGQLGKMMRTMAMTSNKGRRRSGCKGCGGTSFVLCLECSGSCKVLDGDGKGTVVTRCKECNENGLVLCPVCR